MIDERLKSFVAQLQPIKWFSHAGEPSRNVRVVESLQCGWDREGMQMLKVWEAQTHALEAKGQQILSDNAIDHIFSTIADAVHDAVYGGLCSVLDRMYADKSDHETQKQRSVDEGLFPEVMDSVKRDVCWAGVEYVINREGFFNKLLDVYRDGRWPCSWDGNFPQGEPVVF